jgi:GNAT superfamily N-acetyltransferase
MRSIQLSYGRADGTVRGALDDPLKEWLTLRRAAHGSTVICHAKRAPRAAPVLCKPLIAFAIQSHRGRGLSKAMLGMAMDHPLLQGLRRWTPVTADAHELYRQFGFAAVAQPERHMERLDPEIYRR